MDSESAGATALRTFLFTDIEGSTRLWADHPDAMRTALARHDGLLRGLIQLRGGTVFKTMGDAFCAVFDSPAAAVEAAVAAQHALLAEDWGALGALRARMALHTGEAQERDGDFFGTALNRVARLLSAGYGGQVLVSSAVHEILSDGLTSGMSLRDLGEHRLKDLARPARIFQLEAPGLPVTFPALRTLDSRPNNLPIQLTSFVGREAELVELHGLIRRVRLLTLVGVGGTGKTRLALQLAADLLGEFPDGVWLAELAAVDEPDQVAQSVATMLGIQEQPEKPIEATLIEYLQGRQLLLILDNSEHVVDACAALAKQILRAAPSITLLATSREALRIPGEHAWPVPTLGLPEEAERAPAQALFNAESVRLFVARATTQRPTFQLTDDNVRVVAGICRRLDGVPLAIELAAARVRALTPDQILSRLDNRFALLTGQERVASLPHHQTLEAAIDWSHELLSDDEKRDFRRLSIFKGGWTLEAAEAVMADNPEAGWQVLDQVSGLVDKSLVAVSEGPEGEASLRYRMLDTIAAYAGQKLNESEDRAVVAERHAGWYLAYAEVAAPELQGSEQAQWLRRLTADHENLRAARQQLKAEGQDASRLLRLAVALGEWWLMQGRLKEGREWLEEALAAPSAPTDLRTTALERAGDIAYRQGQYPAAIAFHEQALAIRRADQDQRGMARSLRTLGNIADEQGDFARAISLHNEALDIWRTLGDDWGIAAALNNLGLAERRAQNLVDARLHLRESLTRFESLGNDWAVGVTHANLGDVAIDLNEPDVAQHHYAAALTLAERLEDREGRIYALGGLADALRLRGDHEAAWARLAESLVELISLDSPYAVCDWLESAAILSSVGGRATDVARLLGAAEALRTSIGAPMPPNRQNLVHNAGLAAQQELGAEQFDLSLQDGRLAPWRRVADEVLATSAVSLPSP